MIVKVLGSGCAKCNRLYDKVKEVAANNEIQAEIIKETDIQEIMKYKVMMTPAVVINEKVKCYGIIPKEEQILEWLREN